MIILFILFFLADKIRVKEPAHIFLPVGIELLVLDAPLAGYLFGMVARMIQP